MLRWRAWGVEMARAWWAFEQVAWGQAAEARLEVLGEGVQLVEEAPTVVVVGPLADGAVRSLEEQEMVAAAEPLADAREARHLVSAEAHEGVLTAPAVVVVEEGLRPVSTGQLGAVGDA